jgi:hypothetical protein
MNKRSALLIGLALCAVATVSSAATADTRKWKTVHRVDCPTFPVGCSNTADMFSPQVAVDATGNAVAVWQVVDQGAAHILTSRHHRGTLSWEASVPIDGTIGGASDAQVGMDASGNAMIVWTQTDGVQARRRAADGTLGIITSLQSIAGHGSVPQLAVFANGNAIVVWHQSDGTHKRIYARKYTASTNQWEPTARTLDSDASTSDATVAQIAADTAGNALVVWQQGDTQIGANRYSVSTQNWLGATTIPSLSTTASVPRLVMDARAIGLAVWVGFDANAGRDRIWSSRFVDQWEAAVPIEDNMGAVAVGNATAPSIAVDGNSNAVAVWTQFDGAHTNVWSSRYVSTNAQWEGAALIESLDGNAISPAITMDANGSAFAVWQQPTAGSSVTNIYAARYTPSATLQASWEPAALVEHDDGGAFLPRLAFDTNGTAIAIWYQSDGQRFHIASNRYADMEWSAVQQIGRGTGEAPAIAMDANGNAMVVWPMIPNISGAIRGIQASRYSAGTWSAVMTLPTALGAYNLPGSVAFDANGNAMAVWGEVSANSFATVGIFSSRYSASSNTWGSRQLVGADAGQFGGVARVAFDAHANAFVALWQGSSAHPDAIWSSRYINGNWAAPENVAPVDTSTGGFSPSSYPQQLAVAANGDALAIWSHGDRTGKASLWVNRYSANHWGVAAPIQSGNPTFPTNPQLSLDANGNATLVWYQNTGPNNSYEIWAKRSAAGSWSEPQRLGPSNFTLWPPQIALEPNGDALAVCPSPSLDGTDGYGVFSQNSSHYTASSNLWDGLASMPGAKALPVADSRTVRGLQAVSDAQGNALLVWKQEEVLGSSITWSAWANRHIVGGGWGTPFRLDTDGKVSDAGGSIQPQIAIDSRGNGVATWASSFFAANEIWVRTFEQ